jgi:hypothetical protein
MASMDRRSVIGVIASLFLSACMEHSSEDLDTAVRGPRIPPEIWARLDNAHKYDMCLRHSVSVMRRFVSNAHHPGDLSDYYPIWWRRLEDCASLYEIASEADRVLRESVAIEMAKVLGVLTTDYLIGNRMCEQVECRRDPLDMWRMQAIITIAEVADDVVRGRE